MILGRDRHRYSACFDELDRALTALEPSRLVCLNAHAFPNEIPPGAIVYNLENVGIQLSPHAFASHEVWDFSRRNVEAWARPAKHVPLGYHPTMTCFDMCPWAERDLDVVFAGALNGRRMGLLEDLKRLGLAVAIVPKHDYGSKRDALLARAKLALNVRYYDDGLFPALRSAHAVANGLLTVNEESPEVPGWVSVVEPYGKLAARIVGLLAVPAMILRLAARDFSAFEACPLVLPPGSSAPKAVG